MMLADDVVNKLRGRTPLDKAVNADFSERVRKAQKFTLTKEALGMAMSLEYGKPSTMLSVLETVRLPYPAMWFEYGMADQHAAREQYDGKDERPLGAGQDFVHRAGVLVERYEHDQVFLATPVYQFPDGEMKVSYYSCVGDFKEDGAHAWNERSIDIEKQLEYYRLTGSSVLAKRMSKFLASDEEVAAYKSYMSRFLPWPNPIVGEVTRSSLSTEAHREMVRKGIENLPNAREYRNKAVGFARHVSEYIVLLNLKNGVEIRDLARDPEADRKRRRLNRPVMFDQKVLTLRMPKHIVTHGEGGSTDEASEMAAHWVRGHLKVRQTGIYWWSHHVRGDPSVGYVDKTYSMKP